MIVHFDDQMNWLRYLLKVLNLRPISKPGTFGNVSRGLEAEKV